MANATYQLRNGDLLGCHGCGMPIFEGEIAVFDCPTDGMDLRAEDQFRATKVVCQKCAKEKGDAK